MIPTAILQERARRADCQHYHMIRTGLGHMRGRECYYVQCADCTFKSVEFIDGVRRYIPGRSVASDLMVRQAAKTLAVFEGTKLSA